MSVKVAFITEKAASGEGAIKKQGRPLLCVHSAALAVARVPKDHVASHKAALKIDCFAFARTWAKCLTMVPVHF